MIRDKWKDNFLFTTVNNKGKKVVTHRIATIILITITLVNEINKKF